MCAQRTSVMMASYWRIGPLFLLCSFINMMNGAVAGIMPHEGRRLQNRRGQSISTIPTVSPPPIDSPAPTATQSIVPSAMPSFSETTSYLTEADFQHTLTVSEARVMELAEEHLYGFIMENLTLSIGEGIGEPFILSSCNVTESRVAEMRRQTQDTVITMDNSTTVNQHVILVYFRMVYTSRYGHDTSQYPELLKNYINDNQEEVTDYLKTVINFNSDYIVESGVVYTFDTEPPSPQPTVEPTSIPSGTPSDWPSSVPSTPPTYFIPASGNLSTGSILGIVLGCFFGILLIVMGLKLFFNREKGMEIICTDNAIQNDCIGKDPKKCDNGNSSCNNNMFIAVPILDKSDSLQHAFPEQTESSERVSSPSQIRDTSMLSNIPSNNEEDDSLSFHATGSCTHEQTTIASPPTPSSTDLSLSTARSRQLSEVGTFVGMNLLMHDDSFSSDSNDEALRRQEDVDEFDRYKNEVLEQLRDKVEKSIYGVNTMMSIAMTQIFMEEEGASLDLSWVGAEDPASIEASCYFEAFSWMKQDTVQSSETFFQDMLNRVVQIVHRGLIRPTDGARFLHGCASILNMRLLKESPSTTVIVRGLKKMNDLAQGHHFLVKTFAAYGDIIDASISPKNKGFGFIRFVQPQSVVGLMKTYESSDMEIQGISVSIIPIG